MDDQCAKPGDTIEFTFSSNEYFGKRVTVISRPADIDWDGDPGDAWFWWERHKANEFVSLGTYKIVSPGNHTGEIKDSVDKSLKRQLNDNLRGAFGY